MPIGTRDAATHWQECVAEQLSGWGFIRSKAYPSLYYHPIRKIHTLIHGDDYVSTSTKDQLHWLKQNLEKAFEIKTDIRGLGVKEIRTEGQILNRLIRVDSNGCQVEADPRHLELLAEELRVDKELATSGVEEKDNDEYPAFLDSHWSSRYRSLVARANYLATDRPDIGFAVKELCKSMSSPTVQSWDKLIRVAKYIKKHPRLVIHYNWQSEENELQVYSDAHWAGCKHTRKSTSGG